MPDPTLEEQIEAAEAYEGLYVPALFAQFATELIEATELGPR